MFVFLHKGESVSFNKDRVNKMFEGFGLVRPEMINFKEEIKSILNNLQSSFSEMNQNIKSLMEIENNEDDEEEEKVSSILATILF